MASVDFTEQYVHTNAAFSIDCTFTGDESPTGVTWTMNDGNPFVDGTDDYTLIYIQNQKRGTLIKISPSSADDGPYQCLFVMETEDAAQPTATASITVARKRTALICNIV